MNPNEEARLRELLDDAVADVEPRPALDVITARTAQARPDRRPWLYGAGAAVAATAATVTAFAVLGPDAVQQAEPPPATGPVATEPAEDPTTEPLDEGPDTADPEPVPVDAAVPVYYVGETGQGPRLYREFHPGIGAAPLAQALSDAVGRAPDDPDYATPWPAGTGAEVLAEGPDEIRIDVTSPAGTSLHDRPAGMSAALADIAVQQLVYSAHAATQTTAPVQFFLDGGRTDQLLGVPVSEPLARAEETSTLAQVWIISPGEGASVPSGFTVEGIGAFFEANVVWELTQGDTVVRDGFTTAEECCRMAPYSFTVDAPPGTYTLVVRDDDVSGGEGPEPFSDTKTITVTG